MLYNTAYEYWIVTIYYDFKIKQVCLETKGVNAESSQIVFSNALELR